MFAPDDRRVDGLSIGLKRLDVARTKGELVSALWDLRDSAYDMPERWTAFAADDRLGVGARLGSRLGGLRAHRPTASTASSRSPRPTTSTASCARWAATSTSTSTRSSAGSPSTARAWRTRSPRPP